MKIALLTNEIPPIVYGGVATWILNFLDMFRDDPEVEVILVFLAHLDEPPTDFPERYPGIRIIHGPQDIEKTFQDIDITVNNLWVAFDTTKAIKDSYPEKRMISVCHSLIKMEHLTNLGGDATKSFYEQEITFQYSDAVVLISRAELGHYTSFGYDKYDAEPIVIYNSYTPKLDEIDWRPNYALNDIGYIGRHVPRKRPDLPILAVERSDRNDVRVFNMGVDYRGETGNPFWEEMGRKHPKQLVIIPFSSNKETVHFYWNSFGANCITGVYEPFGYTMCETLDRRVPAIVQDIDGPKEICELVKDSVFEYHVEKDFEQDIQNFKEAVVRFWDTHPDDRASMANHAHTALDGFRPGVIKEEWKKVFLSVENRVRGKFSAEELEKMNRRERGEQIYGYSKS